MRVAAYHWHSHGPWGVNVRAEMSAAELRSRRVALGMSQRSLATELGVTTTTVARWERGERAISNAVLVRLALGMLEVRVSQPRHAALPGAATALIGRDGALRSLGSLLADSRVRLLTLTGAGGAGKTSLALAAARAVTADDATTGRTDGALLVELADLPPGALVDSVVANALGLREVAGEPVPETVARALRRSDLLLVLDNCEHVAASVAGLLAFLLPRCPEITVLATSREPLRLRAEHVHPVTPLPVPDLDRIPPPAALLRVPAVTLFVTRWSARHPGFRLTSAQARAVADVCVRLDGLPLALELAAAYGRSPTPAGLLDHLDAMNDAPSPLLRDVPERHRSLRALLDWSYRLLDPQTRMVFRRIGVFAGGFDRRCAAEVIGVDDLRHDLDALIDASLVVPMAESGGRLRLLATVRSYACELLAEADEFGSIARRHAVWLLRWARAGAANFESQAQLGWLADIDTEIANVRAALNWSRSEHGDPGLGLELAAAVRRYWDMRGLPTEAHEQLTALLGATAGATQVRLGAVVELGGLAVRREDLAAIESYAREAADMAAQLGEPRGICQAGELLTYAAFLRADAPLAREMAQSSYDAALRADHPAALAHASMAQGVAALLGGDADAAIAHLVAAMENARARGDRWFIGECGSVLTYVYLARGEHETARATEMESLAARVALRNRPGIALNLKLIGIAEACAGHHDRAALLFGGATAIEETTGEVWNKHWLGAYQQAISEARDKLGSRFTERWQAGRTMREADVVMIALARSPTSAMSPPGAGQLTSRETQVSELIAEGLTSQEIAHRLRIARRTAEAHTEHIMTKLGVRSRAQVAVWVERTRQTRRYV